MSQKKPNTKPAKRARATMPQNRSEVILSFPFCLDGATTPDMIERWKEDGEIYAEMFSDLDLPIAFKDAFRSIFLDQLVARADFMHPDGLAAAFPLVMICLQGHEPVTSDTLRDVLVTLRETLAPEVTERAIAIVKRARR